MKKLLTICLLIATSFTANAQSNEETIKFIEANLKKIVGQKDEYGKLFTNVSFDGEKFIITQNIGSSERPILYTKNHSNLNWENVKFRIYDDESLKSKIPGFEELWVLFEKPIRYKVNDNEVKEKTRANFYVPIDKVEDLKKACIQLSEIAKKESFDPTVKYINNKIVCCSEQKISTIKATPSGDISWLVGERLTQINFFDLKTTKGSYGTTTILESEGIRLFKVYSNYVISFQIDNNNVEYLHEFRSQAEAERVYNALIHLRSLCTKAKDPFDK